MLVTGNTELEKEEKMYTLLSPSSYKQTVFGCLTLKFFTSGGINSHKCMWGVVIGSVWLMPVQIMTFSFWLLFFVASAADFIISSAMTTN